MTEVFENGHFKNVHFSKGGGKCLAKVHLLDNALKPKKIIQKVLP